MNSWSRFSRPLSKRDALPTVLKPLKPSSSEKALEVGADLVRKFFCYLEFDFRVSGMYLDYSG
jgi:hypothetical protein